MNSKTIFVIIGIILLLILLAYLVVDSNAGGLFRTSTPTASRTNTPTATNTLTMPPTVTATLTPTATQTQTATLTSTATNTPVPPTREPKDHKPEDNNNGQPTECPPWGCGGE